MLHHIVQISIQPPQLLFFLPNLQHPFFIIDYGPFLYIYYIVVEFAERFAYQGLASNLINYLTKFLNEPTTTAVKNVNTWVGVSSLFPLLGGFIADSYLGRFNTILLSSLIYLVVNIFSTSLNSSSTSFSIIIMHIL